MLLPQLLWKALHTCFGAAAAQGDQHSEARELQPQRCAVLRLLLRRKPMLVRAFDKFFLKLVVWQCCLASQQRSIPAR